MEAKEKIDQVFTQARESFKLLQTFEKEALAKARSFVKKSNTRETLQLTNDTILAGLRKLGVATQAEVDALKFKLQDLEASMKSTNHAAHSKENTSSVKE